jgi:hypothetical protein
MPARARLSLAALLNASVPIRVDDVSALIRRLSECSGRMTVTPLEPPEEPLRPEYVWFYPDGSVQLLPGVVPTVRDLGALLEQLLGEIRRRGPARIPPGLVLVAARATGKIDLAPLPSTTALAAALERFDPPDPTVAFRALFEAGVAARAAAEARQARVAAAPRNVDPQPLERPESPGNPLFGTPDQQRHRSSRRRRLATLLVGAVALAAGMASAVALRTPVAPAPRPTEATEVTIRPADPKPEGTSGRLSQPDRNAADNDTARDTPAATPRRAPVPTPEPVPASDSSRSPETLLEPEMADADAAFSPSFAANGSAVFFHAQSGTGSALKRADRNDNGELHVVTIVDDTAKNYHVQLSPDSRSVAFDSDRDGVRGVYLAAADGSGVRRVSGPGYAAVPSWSPDGRSLAFLRAEDDKPAVWNLWMMDLGTSDMTRLTNHPYGQVWGGAWFPDGRRIAYSHEDRLLILDLDSVQVVSYTSPRAGRLVRTPAVSPDGRWIMFQVFRDGAWLLNLASGSMERVLDDATAEEFTWAPDGRRVAFHSRRSGEWGLWQMAAR